MVDCPFRRLVAIPEQFKTKLPESKFPMNCDAITTVVGWRHGQQVGYCEKCAADAAHPKTADSAVNKATIAKLLRLRITKNFHWDTEPKWAGTFTKSLDDVLALAKQRMPEEAPALLVEGVRNGLRPEVADTLARTHFVEAL